MTRQSAAAVLAALLLLIGHFAPWAAHKTAALTRSAHDLSISTNFTPGAGIFLNEWFLLPLWSSAILLALSSALAPLLPRSLALIFALVIASLGLPTYPQVLTAFRDPNYQLQFFITLAIFALVVFTFIFSRRMLNIRPYILLGCAIASAVPVIGYFPVKPFIEELYGGSVGVGWGWWVTLFGVLLLLASASATILTRFARKCVH